jgi:hypothetical protein
MLAVPAFPRFRRTAFALGLCLLAFAFAMEAKLTCYAPANAPATELHAAKAYPADTPDVMAHSAPARNPALTLIPLVLLTGFTFSSLLRANAPLRPDIAGNGSRVFAATYFFHPLFFRPPPSFR